MITRKISIKKYILTSASGRNVSVKTGETIVYIEVIKFFTDGSRKTKRIDTYIKVKPQDFDLKKGLVLPTDKDYLYKNDIVDRAWRRVQYEIKDIEAGKPSTAEVAVLFPQAVKGLTDYFDDYIEFRKKKRTPRGTLKEFTTCKNRLIRFETHQRKKLHFEDMTLSFSDAFNEFLMAENFQSGTIRKTYTILVTVLHHFYFRRNENKLNIDDTFKSRDFKQGKTSENKPKPLSKTELDALIAYKFDTDNLNRTKDRFLFQCSTGMRYSDTFLITPDNIVEECIEYEPTKTIGKKRDNLVILPLNTLSKSILENYEFDMRRLAITNQKYNKSLKEMFGVLIKEKPKIFKQSYTSHDGRDTFITNCLQQGIDVPTLLRMVGQESYNVMKRYYKGSRVHSIEKMKLVKQFDSSI